MAEADATPAAGSTVADVRAVLRIAAFRKLWIALSLSSLGDWLGLLATTALAKNLVASHGQSAGLYAIGGVLFVRVLPALVFGPIAGAFADRFNRRFTMVAGDTVRFALYVSIAVAHNLPWLLVASFLIETVSLFWIPAKEASVPNLVPGERLESANQVSLITTYGSAAVASLVFSLLALVNRALSYTGLDVFKADSVNLALYFDAATFLFSALTVLQLKQISSAARVLVDGESPLPPSLARSVVEGWRFIGRSRWLRGVLIGMLGGFAAAGAVVALSRVYVGDLRAGNAGYGVMFGVLFVGLASGMFLGPRLLPGFSRRRMMGLAIVAAGVALALDAVMPNLLLAILFTYLVGAFAGVAWVTGLTSIGLGVDDELRGRTFSFMYTVMRLDLLVVLAAAPFIAGAIGPHRVHLLHVPIRLDGVTLTLFGAGVMAAAVGLFCYRLMDDHPGISVWRELVASFRRQIPLIGHTSSKGVLIAFEGVDGAGKSTQAARLAEWLRAQGWPDVVLTREPGATALGQRVRALLLDRDTTGLSDRAEALLYAADRAQHVAEVIEPALARGAIVLTDRYVDSSLAYQGAGRTLPTEELESLGRWATGGIAADLVVVLDLDPEVGRHRRTGPDDRLEAEPAPFHQRVRDAFLTLASREPDRYLVVDATLAPDIVQDRIRTRVHRVLPPGEPVRVRGASVAEPIQVAER